MTYLTKSGEILRFFVLEKTGTGTDVPFSIRNSGHTCSVMRVKDISGIS